MRHFIAGTLLVLTVSLFAQPKADGSAQDLYTQGVLAYEQSKSAGSEAERSALLERAATSLEAAAKANAGAMEPLAYLSVVRRAQAELAPNAREKQRLIAEADGFRARAQQVGTERIAFHDLRGWSVDIVQGGSVRATAGRGDGLASAVLDRKPFTIRVRLSEPVDVLLNALTSDATAQRVTGGFEFARDCPPDDVVPTDETMPRFPCSGTSMALEPQDTKLRTGETRTHLLSSVYLDESWTRTSEEGGRRVFERDVTEIDGKRVASWGKPLVLVLVIAPAKTYLADEDIRRFAITFR
jgi:hypothetical protein